MQPATRNAQPGTCNPEPATRSKPACCCVELPETDYRDAWNLQTGIVDLKMRGILDSDVVLLLEHPPVFTLGRRGGRENLTVPETTLAASNIQVVHVERGGNITYHGPGQMVVYPIMDLKRRRLAVTELVSGMEEIMIRIARDFGVQAGRNAKNRGVWVGNRKLGSIGIAVRKGISFHGFALNINTSLTAFEWIHPCGLRDIGVTSLQKELGGSLSMADVKRAGRKHLEKVLGLSLSPMTDRRLKALLSDMSF